MSGTAMAAVNEWQKPIFGAGAPPSYLSHPLSSASGGISCTSSQLMKPDTSQKVKESSLETKTNKTKKKKNQKNKSQQNCSQDTSLQNSSDFERNCNKLNNNYLPYNQNCGWATPLHGYQNGRPYSPNPTGYYNQQYCLFSGPKEQTTSSSAKYSQQSVPSNNNNYKITATNNCVNYPANNCRSNYNYNYPAMGFSSNSINPNTELSNSNNYLATRVSNNNDNNNNYLAIAQSGCNQSSYNPAMKQSNNINNGYYSAIEQHNNLNNGYMSNSGPTTHCQLPSQQYNKNKTHHQYQAVNTGHLSTTQQNNYNMPPNFNQQQDSCYPAPSYFTPWQQSGNYSYSAPQTSSFYSTSPVTPVSDSFYSKSPSYQSPPTSPTSVSNPKTFNTTPSSSSFFSNQTASYSHVGGQSYSQSWYQYSYPYYGGYPSFYSYPYCQYTSSASCSANAQVNCGQKNMQFGNLKSGEKASIPETIFVPNYRLLFYFQNATFLLFCLFHLPGTFTSKFVLE
uniref:Uncharacterized protein n=1 Tax=Octopus bimaculoides TaxID=37653 RepID=A0A0L8FZZ6_OCTBM